MHCFQSRKFRLKLLYRKVWQKKGCKEWGEMEAVMTCKGCSQKKNNIMISLTKIMKCVTHVTWFLLLTWVIKYTWIHLFGFCLRFSPFHSDFTNIFICSYVWVFPKLTTMQFKNNLVLLPNSAQICWLLFVPCYQQESCRAPSGGQTLQNQHA